MNISTPQPATIAALDRLYDEINALGGSVPDGDFIGQIRMELLDQVLAIIDKHRRRFGLNAAVVTAFLRSSKEPDATRRDDERRARLARSLRADPDCVARILCRFFEPQRSDGPSSPPGRPARRSPEPLPPERLRRPLSMLDGEDSR
jgi:hypothetical protein